MKKKAKKPNALVERMKRGDKPKGYKPQSERTELQKKLPATWKKD